MSVDIQPLIEKAKQLGEELAKLPAVSKYREIQQSVAADPEANRLMADFEKELEAVSRQEQSGMPISDAQQQRLATMQSRIATHIKIKALNLAQVEFMDMIRRVTQAMQRPALEGAMGRSAAAQSSAPAGPSLRM